MKKKPDNETPYIVTSTNYKCYIAIYLPSYFENITGKFFLHF
jgi:hypothetical protein